MHYKSLQMARLVRIEKFEAIQLCLQNLISISFRYECNISTACIWEAYGSTLSDHYTSQLLHCGLKILNAIDLFRCFRRTGKGVQPLGLLIRAAMLKGYRDLGYIVVAVAVHYTCTDAFILRRCSSVCIPPVLGVRHSPACLAHASPRQGIPAFPYPGRCL